MTHSPRHWLVTGVSSGIGRALAELLIKRGDIVIGTVRKDADRDRFTALGPQARPLVLDVANPTQSVVQAVQTAVDAVGGLDVLVNNAGYGLVGAVEESTEEEARHQMETNFWGPWKLIRATLPALRASNDARIINISSRAGFEGVPGMSLYNASKFALSGLSHSLRLELATVGVKVTTVEPGGFRTEWAGAGIRSSAARIDAYASATDRLRSGLAASDGKQPGDPRRAAEALVELATHPSPPLRLQLGTDAVRALKRSIEKSQADLSTWHEVSVSTDFPNGE